MDIPATVFATLISTAVASTVAWLISVRTIKAQEKRDLHDRLRQMTEISIRYPELEDDEFCDKWPETGPRTENYQRYDNYCCLVFNFVEAAFDYFKGDPAKIERYFGVSELINRHRKWWRSRDVRKLNSQGYPDPKFRLFVTSRMKEN